MFFFDLDLGLLVLHLININVTIATKIKDDVEKMGIELCTQCDSIVGKFCKFE